MKTPCRSLALFFAPAVLVAASTAQAPEPVPQDGPASGEAAAEVAEEPADAVDRKRLLHLTGGSVVRGRTRQVEGRWEVRTAGAWQPLPPGSVERVVDERRLLQQSKVLEREVGSGDRVRRVALADWMLGQGLAEEALAQLDRVLLEEPGQPDAVRMLQSAPASLQVFRGQDDPEELMRAAAKASPAVRELALARMGELEGEALRFERFRENLGSHSHRMRTLAAQGLGRQFPGEEVKSLLGRSVLDGSDDVRREAAAALGQAGEPGLLNPLIRALGSQHSAVRENAIQAIGNTGYHAGVPALMGYMTALASAQSSGAHLAPRSNIFVGRQIAYIQDFDVEVAQFASIADPQINVLTEGSVLDVRVHGVHVESIAVESRKLRRSLAQLTGEDAGTTNRSWLNWWEEHQGDWAPAE
jgi:hypothetical protein